MYDLKVDRRHDSRRSRQDTRFILPAKAERRNAERRRDKRSMSEFPHLPNFLN